MTRYYSKNIYLSKKHFPPKKNPEKIKNKLRIYPKNHENSKNSKPTVQIYWFLNKKSIFMLSSTLQPSKLPKHLPCPRQITKNSTMLQPNTVKFIIICLNCKVFNEFDMKFQNI